MGLIKSLSKMISSLFGDDNQKATTKGSQIKIKEVRSDGKTVRPRREHTGQKSKESSNSKEVSSSRPTGPKAGNTRPTGPSATTSRPTGPKAGNTRPATSSDRFSTKDSSDGKAKPIKRKSADTDRNKRSENRPKAPKNNTPLMEDFVAEDWDISALSAPEVEGKVRFIDMDMPKSILRGIYDTGFLYCTDIQAEILPFSVKGGDVSGRAQTGTGKTAAFLLTILYRLINEKPTKPRKYGTPRALIMAPTRELVIQIEKDAKGLAGHCGARILAVFGGMDYDKQKEALEDYVDIVIATPGRILDYYKTKDIHLDQVEILVLDEADRMLDMGFLPDMRRIINATPPTGERQTMLFSATLTPEIRRLASMWTSDPKTVEIEPNQVTSADVQQLVYIVTKDEKFTILYNLLQGMKGQKVIIFANRKDQVKNLTDRLMACGFSCGMLTGDVGQVKRIKTLENLRNSNIDILIATDVAGRGIHVDNVEAVFNYTLPDSPDDYVHRIGRTGRAGAKGLSISFATEEDSYALPQIETHIKEGLNYVTPEEAMLMPLPAEMVENIKKIKSDKRKSTFRSQPGGRPPRAGGFKGRKPQR